MSLSISEQAHQGKSKSERCVTTSYTPPSHSSLLADANSFSNFRYGIAPRLLEPGAKPRIEVFNPCDDADDQKTSTAILFSDNGDFIAFGNHALQRYAEMLDDEETGMLF